jgi:Flp pilus assembly protein TadG
MTRSLKRRNQRGVAVVETALSLLPFFVFLFAILEGAWFFYVQVTLNNAAREGAKMATRPVTQTDTMMTQDQVRTFVADFLTPIGVNCPTCVTMTSETTASGQVRTRIRVQVSYTPVTLSIFNSLAFPMKGESVMRNETSNK